MDLGLAGKRALVTGSSSGLGEAIARLLAREGTRVVVHGRDAVRTQAVVDAITTEGGAATMAIGDLRSDEQAEGVAAAATSDGPVDILVNNAGAYHHVDWRSAGPSVWAETYDTNVLSAVRMIERLVPPMRERRWGRVIQIGGGLASQPIAAQPDYNASLAARHNLAVSLARDLRGTGVTSNVVSPGAILVPAVKAYIAEMAPAYGWGEEWEEIERNAVAQFVPNDVGRFGRPEEVAAAVAYLASGWADYVSGATIRVDGGTIRSAF